MSYCMELHANGILKGFEGYGHFPYLVVFVHIYHIVLKESDIFFDKIFQK